jgi:DNA-binding MarR family transcriptional regulator
MSSMLPAPADYVPLIALVHWANRALQSDMVRQAHRRGHPEIKQSYNAVFATLDAEGNRAIDMAAQANITRQSMGEILREMVQLGILEMHEDPADRRAKLVTYTPDGLAMAREGFGHIMELEKRFAEEFGAEDYERTREILVRVAALLEDDTSAGPVPEGKTT